MPLVHSHSLLESKYASGTYWSMKHITRRRLSLQPETIRDLCASQLRLAAGGRKKLTISVCLADDCEITIAPDCGVSG